MKLHAGLMKTGSFSSLQDGVSNRPRSVSEDGEAGPSAAGIGENPDASNTSWSDRRIILVFFLTAIALYLPGIRWGLPHATAPDRTLAWGSDEIAPLGPVAELYSVFVAHQPTFNPQYPLLPYLVQATTVAPYVVWLRSTGGLVQPSVEFPYGLRDPVSALERMTVLARLTSLILAAGLVAVAFKTATVLWGRRTGILAGVVTMLSYPMFYYSRTSNVDMGALFWTGLGLMVFACCLRDSLNPTRAAWLGVFAGLSASTKDASYAAFAMIAAVLLYFHWKRRRHSPAVAPPFWRPLWIGLLVTAAVYAVASGMVFSLARYQAHVRFISRVTHAYTYPAGLEGALGLIVETLGHIADGLSLPVLLFSLAGIASCAIRRARSLAMLLPALGMIAGTILPIQFVTFRYVMVSAYILGLFAAWGLCRATESPHPTLARISRAVLVCVCVWLLVRGMDLTHQMIYDSRYEVAAWFRENTRPGDRVGYFGAAQKLPPLEQGVISIPAESICTPSAWTSPDAPAFVALIPQQHFEILHEWSLSPKIYRALEDGSLGYRRQLQLQTRSLFSHRPVSFVNPPVQVFVREDRLSTLTDPRPVLREYEPVFSGLEKWLGISGKRPAGLQRNYERRPEKCPEWVE